MHSGKPSLKKSAARPHWASYPRIFCFNRRSLGGYTEASALAGLQTLENWEVTPRLALLLSDAPEANLIQNPSVFTHRLCDCALGLRPGNPALRAGTDPGPCPWPRAAAPAAARRGWRAGPPAAWRWRPGKTPGWRL